MIEAPSAPGPTSSNTVVEAIRTACETGVEGGWRTVCNAPGDHGLEPLVADDWEVVSLALALCPDPTLAPPNLAGDVASWLDAFGGSDRPSWPPSCARSAIYAGWSDPMGAAIFAEQVEALGSPAEAVFDALWDPATDEPLRFEGRTVAEAIEAGALTVPEALLAAAC